MNALDLAVVAVIALSAIFAFARGFVREALSIVAWAGAALIALYGFSYAYGFALRFITTPLLAEFAAAAALFIVGLIVLTMLTGYVARFVQASALSPIDRTLGLLFGVARGAVIVSIAYLVLDVSLPQTDRPGWIVQAKSEPFLAQGADVLRNLLPPALQLKSASAADDTQRALDRARDAQRAMRALSSPAVPLPPKPDQAPGPSYNAGERQNLDRLIQNAH
jgi:membrane protein required for colicin V production